jgi:catechol 2,3-dioxygenase-like lactoylglutathione lyase family enzyme
MDMKLEVVVVPVSDIDQSKEFYRELTGRSPVRRRLMPHLAS